MMSVKTFALSSAFPVSFALFLLAAGPAAASEQNSTPAEKAQTQQLNQTVSDVNSVADAQSVEKNAVYKGQQDRYQQQLRLYRTGQQNYQERSANYLAARERYIAGHAAYHRAAWPVSFNQRLIVNTNDLLGADVHTANGRTVGHVVELALLSGQVSALRVTLDNGRGDVWIESPDLRFSAERKVVMTNLDRRDLYLMSHESY
jgi:sporulation protein YlmC with PRC-barrel domain